MNEQFWQTFESTQSNRFVVHIKDVNGKYEIPSMLIYSISRPSFNVINNKVIYNDLVVNLYDSYEEHVSYNILQKFKLRKFNISILMVDHVGMITESWAINNAILKSYIPSDLNWKYTDDNNRNATINMTFKIDSKNVTLHEIRN